MYAIVKNGGRQYKVSVGETLKVNRLSVNVGDQVRLDEVLLISNDDNTMLGTPLVSNALVLATATEHGRGRKLIVFKYKSKKRYRHRRGHRQDLTFLSIDDIVADGKSLVTGEAPEYREPGASVEEEVEETPEELAETEEAETAEAQETSEPEAEKRTSRRRRTAKAEDTDEKAED